MTSGGGSDRFYLQPARIGPPRADDREVLNGILHVPLEPG